MGKPSKSAQPQDKYVLRLPDGMRESLKDRAAMNGRSMNSEIIERLEITLREWPRIDVPIELYEKAMDLPARQLISIEGELQELAIARIERAVRDYRSPAINIRELFQLLIFDRDVEQQRELIVQFEGLLEKAGVTALSRNK